MENLALVIFSICIQAAIGTMVFVAIAKIFDKDGIFKIPLVTSAVLSIVGLLASLLHLGRPLRALNSLLGFGSSWLSREIWFTGCFTGLTVAITLLILFKPDAKSVFKILIPVTAVVGFIDVFVMASIYYFASVPAWNFSATFIQFCTTMISVGAVLFLAMGWEEATKIRKSTTVVACIAIGVQVVTMINYYLQLAASTDLAAQESASVLSRISGSLTLQWILILLGMGLLLYNLKGQIGASSVGNAVNTADAKVAATVEVGVKREKGLFIFAIAVLIIGQIVGRYIFYAIMVISRVGLS